jgi:hypothetical protein
MKTGVAFVGTSTPANVNAINETLSQNDLAEFATTLADTGLRTNGVKPTATNEPRTYSPQAAHILRRPHLYEEPRPKRSRWIMLCLLLVMLLVGEAIFLLRTEITANWPEMRPYLASFCEWVGCQVPLPKQIDRLTIEASELQTDPARSNVVLVTAILRNRSTTQQAYPLLEITLTDTLDRPIARRSLAAAEYLTVAPKEDEGLSPNNEAVTHVAIETIDIKPSGYRLRLYYR